MNSGIMTAIIGGLLAVSGVVAWNVIPHRRKLERFANRQDLSLDSIYSQFFEANNLPKGLVLELWNEVATPLRIPPGKLRPEDRFNNELAPVKGWELDDDLLDVQWAAQRRLKRLGVHADISAVQSLRDYVELFCMLELARHPN
jgi:hypothetical protein